MIDGQKALGFIISNWVTLLRWILRIPAQPEITVVELKKSLEKDAPPVMIDVRGTEEYAGTDDVYGYGHIPGSLNVPMFDVDDRLNELDQYKDREIVTICPGGGMSLVAVEVLNEAGFDKVRSLKGGTDAWRKKGYPMLMGDSIR